MSLQEQHAVTDIALVLSVTEKRATSEEKRRKEEGKLRSETEKQLEQATKKADALGKSLKETSKSRRGRLADSCSTLPIALL